MNASPLESFGPDSYPAAVEVLSRRNPLILIAARSVIAEFEAGRSVDLERFKWARGEIEASHGT